MNSCFIPLYRDLILTNHMLVRFLVQITWVEQIHIAYAINIYVLNRIPDLRYNLTSSHLNETIIFNLCITWPHWNKFTDSSLKLIQNIWDMFSRLMSNILKYQFIFWSTSIIERHVITSNDIVTSWFCILIHFLRKRA